MNFVKIFGLVLALLFTTDGLAKKRKHRKSKKVSPYVGLNVGFVKGDIYEEVRVGAKWRNTLVGLSYSKFPVHLWNDFTDNSLSSPAQQLIGGTITAPDGTTLDQSGNPVAAVPKTIVETGGYHSVGAFVRHSFKRYSFKFGRKAPRISPHAELQVQYRMVPPRSISQIHRGGVVVDGFVGLDARLHRYVMTSVSAGFGSVFSPTNITQSARFATTFKAEVGAIF